MVTGSHARGHGTHRHDAESCGSALWSAHVSAGRRAVHSGAHPGTADIQPIPVDVRVGFLRTELIEVLRLMEANIEEPLSLEELTRLVNLSQRHLQRMFRFYLNVSPTHYYLTLRLKRARDLLRTTNASIARVTTICGFHSQCHFSKAYRTQFGYAPSHERRIPD